VDQFTGVFADNVHADQSVGFCIYNQFYQPVAITDNLATGALFVVAATNYVIELFSLRFFFGFADP